MSKQQDIRRLDARGLSHSEIARRLKVDRGTVAEYANMEDCSPRPPARRRVKSVLDGRRPLVDSWLEADRLMPRKQRHTARRVYDRLVAERGFKGSYSTVLRYVREWRRANREPGDDYVELAWAPGCARMDFGRARARLAGEWVDDHCLVVTFPHSNKRYVASLPAENAECICEGLATIFGHIGGVPRTLVIDNASGAGHRDARGEVTLSRVFEAFISHYRLDVRFRNPYSGNEKGSVENAVGFLRRNLMVPPMEAEAHERLTRLMLAKCDELGKSIHYRTLDPIDMMFADDVKSLRPLPSRRFDAVRWETRKADKYRCVDIDGNRYQIGTNMHGRRVDVAIRAAKVAVKDEAGRAIIELVRVYGKSARTIQDPATVFPLLAAKPGEWRDCSIRPDIPGQVKDWARPGRRRNPQIQPQGDRESLRGRGVRTSDASHAAFHQPWMGFHLRRPGHARQTVRGRRHRLRGRPARPGRVRPIQPSREGRVMSSRPEPVVTETRRRRADTIVKSQRIMAMSKQLALTRSVLADTLAEATPVQLDFIEHRFQAELDSRDKAKRLRLLKAAGFPADKTLENYDWTGLTMPADWGRHQPTSPDFIDRHEDPVLYGPVGTGKTHLAIAIGDNARFFAHFRIPGLT